METIAVRPPGILKLIAHEIRWTILTELAHSDYRVQELVERLGLPQNLVSYHLRLLREGQVVTERRSSADSRDVYYSLNVPQFHQQLQGPLTTLHPALSPGSLPTPRRNFHLPPPALRVLFLCTKNSARSQIAEGLLRSLSRGQVLVQSAGSEPTTLHPAAIRAMATLGIDISQQCSKHLSTVIHQPFDLVITICDRMREICPPFPGSPRLIHWSVLDPVETLGTEQQIQRAFDQTVEHLTVRITLLLAELEQQRSSDEPRWEN